MAWRRRAAVVLVFLLAAAGAPFDAAAVAGGPRVVASIAPIHALVSGVMAGVGAPALIVRGYGSPHAYQMRPSEAAALHGADLVFWVGEALETFLVKPLAGLKKRARLVSLIAAEGLTLYPARRGGVRATATPVDGGHDSHHPQAGDIDPHVWLAPDNAARLVAAIAAALAEVDPGHDARYAANRDRLTARLRRLDDELARLLAPVADKPFLVLHDAFQYFERHYHLKAVGALTVSPDRPPGARRLRALRARIKGLAAACVFGEPQFKSALLEAVVEGTGAGRGVIDPLGAPTNAGAAGYFAMMRANARAFVACLARRG